MKKIFLLVPAFQILVLPAFGQVLFSSSFNNLTLQTYTSTAAAPAQYTTIPGSFSAIDDGLGNNIGGSGNPNSPFHVPALKTSGWATVYNAAENDTFLVSTSWLDTTGVNVSRWVITPPVSNITANTVLTWLAKSPDPSYREGYEVYGTNKTGTLAQQDFALGDRLFVLADGNTTAMGENNSWTRRSVSIGAFAGQTLRFAFRDNSKDMYQLWIDDVEAVTLPQNMDVALQDIRAEKYVLINTSNAISVSALNKGAANITNISISYQISNSSVNTESPTITGTLSYGQATRLNFALPYNLSSPGLYTIKAWINTINNTSDQDHSNDTVTTNVTVLSAAPSKTLMMEQFLSAGSGKSPDAQGYTSAIQPLPAIIVNIHDEDSLREPGSAALINDYKKDYATGLIDRYSFTDDGMVAVTRPAYNTWVNIEYYRLSPAGISLINKSYNAATRQLSFTIKADFAGEVKGDYRINAYLTENNVCGPYADTTLNGYNQVNGYYNVSWSEYFHQGRYLPSANAYVIDGLHYKHQNTLVQTFDGAYGLPGLIPSTGGTQGQSYQKTFTLTLPTPAANIHKFNPDNIYVVGFISEYAADKTKRRVLNAVREKLTTNPEFVGIPETKEDAALSVYPNPSGNGLFYLNAAAGSAYELRVFDLYGKCLKIETGRSAGTIDLSAFADGIYLLSLRSDKGMHTQKVIIQKN